MLLNSLRRLLTFVPQTNDLLTTWARTTADSPGRQRVPTPGESPSKGNNMACDIVALFSIHKFEKWQMSAAVYHLLLLYTSLCPELASSSRVVKAFRLMISLADAAVLEDENAAPLRGALFDQLVKELRSEYAAAVTACAQRIHSSLAQHKCSIRAGLERYGVSGNPGVMQEQASPLVKLTAMLGVSAVCDCKAISS